MLPMQRGRCWDDLHQRWRRVCAANTTRCLPPHVDTGDSVIVINADKIVLTGRKMKNKTYYHHSGYMGGIKDITAEKLMEKKPEDLVRFAVKECCPRIVWAVNCTRS